MSGAKFRPSDTVDFLVVGAGAAGGVMAKELSTAGFRVVVLEQGPYLTEKDYRHDEIRYVYQSGLTNDTKVQPITYRKNESEAARPIKAIGYGRQVGGGSVHFTSVTGIVTYYLGFHIAPRSAADVVAEPVE